MSWWNYGYQISEMAGHRTLVDNNTWNSSKWSVSCLRASNLMPSHLDTAAHLSV